MISTATDGGVAVITMNRPQVRNALDQRAFEDLYLALTSASYDDNVAAVLLTGADGHFSSGQDLRELPAIGARDLATAPFNAFVDAIAFHPKPVVCAVEGYAIGVGCAILLHADVVIAGQSARFGMPFLEVGGTAEGGTSALLATLGSRVGARMLLCGDRLDAAEAARCGLVTTVVPDGTALAAASGIAHRWAAAPRASLLATKALLLRHREAAVGAALARERAVIRELWTRRGDD
jgi:enoyl-CoA hydratase/carnithine racemase